MWAKTSPCKMPFARPGTAKTTVDGLDTAAVTVLCSCRDAAPWIISRGPICRGYLSEGGAARRIERRACGTRGNERSAPSDYPNASHIANNLLEWPEKKFPLQSRNSWVRERRW